MKAIITFFKKETVLAVSLVLAVISCFFVPPDGEYAGYIDVRVIALLFSLMAVMAGFRSLFVFRRIGRALLKKTKTTLSLCAVLVYLCFFSSMLVTNDVALITFVPFAIEVLLMCGRKELILPVAVFQTIAANLGSMLTPPGNPQNLFLYSVSDMTVSEFVAVMLPFSALSFIMLAISLLSIKRGKIELPENNTVYPALNMKRLIMYILLFIVCLLAVLHIINYFIALIAVVVCLVIADRRIFCRIDYGLLLTFAALFVLVGNLARIDAVYGFIYGITKDHPFAISVGASQIISNVPAALLISGFTDNYTEILKGVNIGGLGTIIASMASLISYKLYAQVDGAVKGRYMVVFTVFNVIFLAALCVLNLII